MSTPNTTDLIVQYLTASKVKQRTIVNRLAENPQEAFGATLAFRGPYPKALHPRDVHDTHLVQLLADLLAKCPELFTGRGIKTVNRDHRHRLICAAISTQDPQFTEGILAGLKDRSIYVKLLVIDAITRYKWLRTEGARIELERLLMVKSIAESDYDRRHVEQALETFKE